MSLGSSIICCCQSPTIVSIANVIVSYPFLMQCSKVWCSLLIYCWYNLLERYNHYQLLKMGYSAFHQKLLDIYSTKPNKRCFKHNENNQRIVHPTARTMFFLTTASLHVLTLLYLQVFVAQRHLWQWDGQRSPDPSAYLLPSPDVGPDGLLGSGGSQ